MPRSPPTSAISKSTSTTRAPRRRPQNFIALAKKGFYDDVVFHRVIPGFVAQAGDGQYGKKTSLERGRVGTGGPGYKFEDEPVAGDYVRGALAMANAGPNTNGSQFFICHQDLTGKLPRTTRCSGRSPRGMDVVDKIVGAPRDGRDLSRRTGRDDLVTIQRRRRLRNLHRQICQKPLENGARGGRIAVLLSQPRCPSDKVMGR